MASEREKAVIRDRAARARLATDPVYRIKQRRPEGHHDPSYRTSDTPTPAQLRVLRLAATGMTNHEIAASLGVGLETVKTHIVMVLARLGASDRNHAAEIAKRAGLIG